MHQSLIMNLLQKIIDMDKAETKNESMGCKLTFQQGQKVILEDITTQYKNYQLPLKQDKAKWNILKTIVSFLNSKGGTIYMGIQDGKGAVQGLWLQRKQRDGFRLYMKQLIEKIFPKVDLVNKQEVLVQYVPVMKGKQFQGKYVVKIVVQQGDPTQTYCFGERIKLQGPNSKMQEFQVFYAYQRHNMGGATQVKGTKLLQLIRERAINPMPISSVFDENSNPQPPHIEVQVRKIHFKGTTKQHLVMLENAFKSQFEKQQIDYTCQYLSEKKTIELVLSEEDQFQFVKNYIVENLAFINEGLFKDEDIQFQSKGVIRNYFLLENVLNSGQNKKNSDKTQAKVVKKEGKKEYQMKKPQKKQPQFPYQSKNQNKVQPAIVPKPVNSPSKNQIKKYALAFTHIEPRAIDQLQAYLTGSICKKYSKYFERYYNTLELFLNSQQQQLTFMSSLGNRNEQLNSFGFKGEIIYGYNQGNIKICNYDRNRGEQLCGLLRNIIKEELRQVSIHKQGNKFVIYCAMKTKALACEWLDLLLKQGSIKRYSIPRKNNEQTAKMKFFLDVRKQKLL